MALTDKLTAIGDAIRTKTGGTDLLTLDQMPAEISNIQGGGTVEELTITSNGTYNPPTGIDGFAPVVVNVPQDGAPTAEDLTFSGDCSRMFANNRWVQILKKYGNLFNFVNVTDASYMFYRSTELEKLPTLNFNNSYAITNYMFQDCAYLKECPDIRNLRFGSLKGAFSNMRSVREIPDSFVDNNDFAYGHLNFSGSATPAYDEMFDSCRSLRRITPKIFQMLYPKVSYSNSIYRYGFSYCNNLEELTNLPCFDQSTWTSNAFFVCFDDCNRLGRVVFSTNEDGTPKVVQWQYQTIDLHGAGFCSQANEQYILQQNSGITADKAVYNDAEYQALKNNPDWYARNANYSRYNHDSAVETINSLPDTSAYLASAGGTNTIKFTGSYGAKTDGGAINTLTEEEIAVATAKGWTVSLV